MRADMFKVIVERPRRGPRGDKHVKGRFRNVPLEDRPSNESMTKKHGYDGKELNEHLSPLYRFIRKQVGRKWDDVFAEICENISMDSTVQAHVRGHVYDIVEKNVEVIDGRAHSKPRRFRSGDEITSDSLYVHPETNILSWGTAPARSNWRTRSKEDFQERKHRNWRVFGKELEALRLNGIWYWVVYKDVPQPRIHRWETLDENCKIVQHEKVVEVTFVDIVESFLSKTEAINLQASYPSRRNYVVHWAPPQRKAKVGETRYRADKRQMSSEDLRKYGLSND